MRHILSVAALTCTFFAAMPPGGGTAQTVLVRVVHGTTSGPVFGALAFLDDPSGTVVKSALTDELGRAILIGIPAGSYSVRVEMIGLATARTEVFAVASGETVQRDIRMEASAIVLEGISVEAEGGRCRVRPEQGLLVAAVWEEARKALSAAAFTDSEQTYRYQTVRYFRTVDRDTKAIRDERRERSAGYLRTPFESRPAEDLLENGFVQNDGDGDLYFAPDAGVLLSDAFLDSHCFKLEQGRDGADGLVGLAFQPAGGRGRVPDIAGTLWLDPATAELRWLDYRYRNLNADLSSPEVGGKVEFRRLPNGTWIVPEWWIRMPTVGYVRGPDGRRQPYLESYRVTGGVVTQVQEAGGRTVVEAETGTINGIVLDSLGAEPLRGARVGVQGSNQQLFTNSEGRFSLTGLTEGVYQVQYTHPSLEAIGHPGQSVVQEVEKGEVVALRLVMPSVADVLFETCRGEERPEGTSVMVGWVRDARTSSPIPGATVQVRWGRVTILAQGTLDARLGSEIMEGLQTTADQNGYFRICSVPEERTITVVAIDGEMESPPDTLQIEPFSGVVVRTLDIARDRR